MRLTRLLAVCAAIAACGNAASALSFRDTVTSDSCRAWVDSVYSSLTPRQRIAQLFIPVVDPTGGEVSKATIKKFVQTNEAGGLLFSKGSIEDFAKMTNYAQSVARVPVLMTLDGEWGLSMRVKDTPRFPYNMGLGAICDTRLLEDYGREVARECRIMGIHVNFAPDADVNLNPANPVIGYRSFGEDPERVASDVVAYSRGLESGGVISVAKHFPGHGDTHVDSHKALPVVEHDRQFLDDTDLVPFRRYIAAGLSGIMTGHLAVPAIDQSNRPASLSSKITTGLLREELGFDGLIFTDALRMKGASTTENNCVAAFMAGADMLLSPPAIANDITAMEEAIKAGKVKPEEVERRCRKVLAYKYAAGLRKRPAPISLTGLKRRLNSPEAAEVNTRLCNASITVLRDNGDLLPMKSLGSKSIAVVNIGASTDGNAFSDYCRRYAAPDIYSTSATPFTAAQTDKIIQHDIVVAAIYNDKETSLSQLEKLKNHPGLVPVFFINPYKTAKYAASLSSAPAIVMAYDDTPLLRRAAAEALFGGINVSGRLPVTIKGVANIGDGVSLAKSRLGFTSPVSESVSASLTDSIDSLINEGLRTGAFPGCQLLIARNGNVIVDRCYGTLASDGSAKVTPATVYDLASVSKAAGTLPGIMLAYDNGLLDLDAPIGEYMPQLAGTDKADLTPRRLLYHESGMPASLNMYDMMIDPASYTGPLIRQRYSAAYPVKISRNTYGNAKARMRTDITSATRSDRFPVEAAKGIFVGRETYDSVMQRIYNVPLRSATYRYSCLNFCMLMDLEQHLTDVSHDRWTADNIYRPLGAFSTCYNPILHYDRTLIAPTENDRFLRRQTVQGYVHDETAAFSGGVQGNAGLFSNATDLAKLCQMLLNGGTYGDARILSEETVRLFTYDKSPTCRRGLGFDKPDTDNPDKSPTCEEAPAELYGHVGFTGTCFWVDPTNNLIFIFLCNRINPSRDNPAFARLDIRPKLLRSVYRALRD